MTLATLLCFLGASIALTLALLARPRVARYFDWLTAGVFATLGIRLALAQR